MNDEDKFKCLLELVSNIDKKIDEIKDRNDRIEYLFFRWWPYIRNLEPIRSEDADNFKEWIRENREEMSAITSAVRSSEIRVEDANLFISMNLLKNTHMLLSETGRFSSDISKLAGKSLLSSCDCGGPLQMLIQNEMLYLTCQRCGRWLWQGLKHV